MVSAAIKVKNAEKRAVHQIKNALTANVYAQRKWFLAALGAVNKAIDAEVHVGNAVWMRLVVRQTRLHFVLNPKTVCVNDGDVVPLNTKSGQFSTQH